MRVHRLVSFLDNLEQQYQEITIHVGGHSWEKITDIVWCQECNQYHIMSERVPLERSSIKE